MPAFAGVTICKGAGAGRRDFRCNSRCFRPSEPQRTLCVREDSRPRKRREGREKIPACPAPAIPVLRFRPPLFLDNAYQHPYTSIKSVRFHLLCGAGTGGTETLDYTIRIGGEAGQGMQTIGDALGKIFTRSGYYVFIHQDYESRIRGGHNFVQVRVSDSPVGCSRDCADIVLAFDRASIGETGGKLAPSGIIVYDPAMLKEHHEGPQFLEVPFVKLATQDGGSRIMANTVATGALLGMLGLPLDVYMDVITRADSQERRCGRR